MDERHAEIQEGDNVVLRAKVARANEEQALIEFVSMDGPFSLRVPITEIMRVGGEW